jgi:hypothetical protein
MLYTGTHVLKYSCRPFSLLLCLSEKASMYKMFYQLLLDLFSFALGFISTACIK